MDSDDTRLAAKGRYTDGSNVRFWNGKPEIIGGWEGLIGSPLNGVCRSVYQWTDAAPVLNVAFGTHSNLQVWVGGSFYDITPTRALPPATLGADPIATSSGSPTVVVTQNGHPHAVGESVVFSGAAAVGGITVSGTYTVVAVTTNTFTITHGSNASSTATGGGSAVVVTPQRVYTAGQVDGTGGAGYGTGAFGVGTFGSPSLTDYFPRTWALDAWGVNLVASPRLGTIYQWTNDGATRAQPVANAPAKVRNMLVSHSDQVFALGCNEEASGIYNPLCIRYSSVRDITAWNTAGNTTAREYVLQGGGEIVAGRVCGTYILVWTTAALYVGTFVGDLDTPWRFDRVAVDCGLIGPNAVVVVGQRALWLSPDLQFRSYNLGGAPEIVPCPIRKDMVDHISASQADKIVASSISRFNEVRWDYPDERDGFENSRYVAVSLQDGQWYRGQMARTALVDAGPSNDPIGVDVTTAALTYGRSITNDAEAAAALQAIGNLNLYAKADWLNSGSASITPAFGVSGWGFRITGPAQAGFRASGYAFGLSTPYSVSFKARATAACQVTVGWRDAGNTTISPDNPDITLNVTTEVQTFRIENIVSTWATFPAATLWFFSRPAGFPGALPAGDTLDITDIKVEAGATATAWSPATTEASLYATYGAMIAGLTYSQPAGNAYWHERGYNADGAPLAWFLETGELYMKEDFTSMFRCLWPDVQDQRGPWSLTLYTRLHPRGEVRQFGPQAFSSTDDKVDLRASGRLFRVRLSGSSSPASGRLGRLIFDIAPSGKR